MSTTAVYPKCAKCGRDIIGSMLLNGLGTAWHPHCFDAAATTSPSPDLIERLRADAKYTEDVRSHTMLEAASELSRLRAELASERSERQRVSDLCDEAEHERATAEAALAKAREALTEARTYIIEDGEGYGLDRRNALFDKIDAALIAGG